MFNDRKRERQKVIKTKTEEGKRIKRAEERKLKFNLTYPRMFNRQKKRVTQKHRKRA